MLSSLKRIQGRPFSSMAVGQIINHFQVTHSSALPQSDLTLVELKHIDLNTKVIHLHSESDLNNCLAINFTTLPDNDKGVPHILEHLATCGSHKYKIRDPFMKMVKRSLNTFMNALTGPDFTSYPFSSANTKDFENLMDIYMDISYRPLLRLNDFRQEGWRLTNNKDGTMAVNGVVFNEMKGVVQDMGGVYNEALLNNLHDGNTYTSQSGGHPDQIYYLSYEELKQFHNTYYHPSNSTVYLYGSYDIDKLTHKLHNEYLSHYEPSLRKTVVPTPKWNHPRTVTVTSQWDPSAQDPTKQAKYSLSWLCTDIVDSPQEDQVGLQVLAHMLLHTPTSPFYKSLIESHLSPSFSPGTGFDRFSSRQSFLSVGVSDLEEGDEVFNKIEQTIMNTLLQTVEQGLEQDLVQGTLHQYSIDFRQQKANVGLRHLFGLFQVLNHDASVQEYFKTASIIDDLATRTAAGEKYFENLIQRYLIDNKHVLKLKMVARHDHFLRSEQREKQFLQEMQQTLTQEEKQHIDELNASLEKEQNQRDTQKEKELLAQLPSVSTQDILRQKQRTESEQYQIDGVGVEWLDVATNGMTYFRLRYSLENMSDMHKQYVRLLCETLPRVGGIHHNYQQMSEQLGLYTTDLSVSYHCHVSDSPQGQHYIILSIGCLDQHIEQMMALLASLLGRPAFDDKENLYNLTQQLNTQNLSSLTEDSMGIAQEVVVSNVQPVFRQINRLQDIQYLQKICTSITRNGQQDIYMEDMGWHLEQVMRHITTRARLQVIVHSNKNNQPIFQKAFSGLIDTLAQNYINFERKGNAYVNIEQPASLISQKEFYKLPLQVNYCMQAMRVPRLGEQHSAHLQVYARVAANTLLHREIREKGGAYGSGMRVDPLSSVASLFSYRDPHTLRTYEQYQQCLEQIASGRFNEQDVEEAKLTLFQKMDAPIVNHNKGLGMFMMGINQDMIQQNREQLLDAGKEQIMEAAQKHVMARLEEGESARVIFGADKAEQVAELQQEGWHVVDLFPGE